MTTPAVPRPKAERLFWVKYNPTEWQGMYSELSDEEYGLFHRVIAKLWATPGNRLNLAALLADLRVKPDSERARVVQGLVGYVLKEAEDGLLYVQAIDDAFADAVKRGSAGTAGAAARWNKPKPAPATALSNANPHDF